MRKLLSCLAMLVVVTVIFSFASISFAGLEVRTSKVFHFSGIFPQTVEEADESVIGYQDDSMVVVLYYHYLPFGRILNKNNRSSVVFLREKREDSNTMINDTREVEFVANKARVAYAAAYYYPKEGTMVLDVYFMGSYEASISRTLWPK